MYSKKKRIEISKDIYMNRTVRYIAPVMKLYGDELTQKFNNIKWLAFGINDRNYKEDLKDGDYIFCLCNITNNKHFDEFISYIRKQYFYFDDYIYSIRKNLHVVVINNPRRDIIPHFLSGKYSQMFSKEDIDRIYLKKIRVNGVEKYTDVYSILKKFDAYKNIFLDKLYLEFGSSVIEGDYEYDLPPLLNEEVFNYDEESPYSEKYYQQQEIIKNA